MKKFYLVDGHAQIFRGYYAPFHLLTSPAGEPIKATHIFTQMILTILREKQPDYFGVAMDVKDSTTFRRAVYPEYKANREETPEDLIPQVERIAQIIELFGIPLFRQSGYEADDLIATIAKRLAGEDVELLVVSRDKDLYQIVTDNVKLWDPVKDEILDRDLVEAKYGFSPEQAIEIQTLTGDNTDNVPGIHGVGIKKAVALLGKYKSAAGVLEHADELSPKLRENVLAYSDQLECTRELVTLDADVPVDFNLEACAVKPVPTGKLRPLFEELGFRRLTNQLDELDGGASVTPVGSEVGETAGSQLSQVVSGQYRLVDTPDDFKSFVAELRRQSVFALDTETTSLRPVECDIVGLSFSWKAGDGYYLPLRSRRGETLDPVTTLAELKPILEDDKIQKCGQNLKYDLQVLHTAGIDLRGVSFDTMIASYLLHPERRGHGMDALAKELLGHKTIPIRALIGKGKEEISLLDVDLPRLADYAAEDADITWRLYEKLKPAIDASPMKRLYYDVELPLVEVLAGMEFSGVRLDVELLRSISGTMAERIVDLREQIYKAAGREFVVDSPKQLGEILFDELGFRVVKKTKTSRSTDAAVLTTLAAETDHPLPRLVLEYRELAKLKGTYVDPLPQLVSERSGRLHASFHQTVAATGRLSSSDPNIQNIPVRTEQGREIRKAFVAQDADHALIIADYSQIELRVLAHFSRDEELLKAFREDQDVHAFVAAQVAGIRVEEVTREQRTQAKAINFGIIYGQGAFGLAQTLGIPRQEAAAFIASYKRRYPGIVRFIDQCVAAAEETGRVSTLLGRQRAIPEIHSKNRMRRALGERLAINTVVQGTAADIIKAAMIRLDRRIKREERPLRILIQVHDELVLESRRDVAEESARLAKEEMEAAIPLDVALRVDVGWGSNWLEAK